jgi:DNA-directed RNA polymerase specialized sigma24 family protein
MSAPVRRPRRARTATRQRITRAIARHGSRERLALMLLLVERLSPLEIAVALGLSVRQVERTLGVLFLEFGRVARPARSSRIRRAA